MYVTVCVCVCMCVSVCVCVFISTKTHFLTKRISSVINYQQLDNFQVLGKAVNSLIIFKF